MEARETAARRQAEWLTDKFILLMLFLFPLFTGLRGYSDITRAKLWFFLTAAALWLMGLLVCLCRGLRPKLRDWGLPLLLLCGFLFWNVLSALLSPYGFPVTLRGAGRYDGLFTTLLYGLCTILIARLGRPRILYARVLGVSVFLCCAVALGQIAGFDPLRLYPNGWRFADAGIAYSGMYLGTVGNTLILASVLSLSVPVLCYTAARRKQELWLLLPTAMSLYVLLRSESASFAVGLLGSVFLVFPMALSRKQRLQAFFALVPVLLGLLALLYFWPERSGSLYEASRLLHGQAEDSFGSHRIQIWRAAWDCFRQRPFWGGGPGTLALRLNVTFSRFVPETGQTLRSYTTNAHNEYLGYLCNLGVGGLMLYLAALVSSFFSSSWESDAAFPWGWGVAAYAVQAFFALGLCLSAPLFWIGWGLFLSASQVNSRCCGAPDGSEIPPPQ